VDPNPACFFSFELFHAVKYSMNDQLLAKHTVMGPRDPSGRYPSGIVYVAFASAKIHPLIVGNCRSLDRNGKARDTPLVARP
jgi:hypothetical protein